MNGILYIVSTPIGDPEDISLRALRVLREVILVVAEEARITRLLLKQYDIPTEVISYRPRREKGSETTERIRTLLTSGASLALVCDAGTPTLADPGAGLIHSALSWKAHVVPVPGANA